MKFAYKAGHLEDILTDDNLIYPFEFIARSVAEYNRSLDWSNYGFAYMSRKYDMIEIEITLWKTLYFKGIPGTIYFLRVDNPEQKIEERLKQLEQLDKMKK